MPASYSEYFPERSIGSCQKRKGKRKRKKENVRKKGYRGKEVMMGGSWNYRKTERERERERAPRKSRGAKKEHYNCIDSRFKSVIPLINSSSFVEEASVYTTNLFLDMDFILDKLC